MDNGWMNKDSIVRRGGDEGSYGGMVVGSSKQNSLPYNTSIKQMSSRVRSPGERRMAVSHSEASSLRRPHQIPTVLPLIKSRRPTFYDELIVSPEFDFPHDHPRAVLQDRAVVVSSCSRAVQTVSCCSDQQRKTEWCSVTRSGRRNTSSWCSASTRSQWTGTVAGRRTTSPSSINASWALFEHLSKDIPILLPLVIVRKHPLFHHKKAGSDDIEKQDHISIGFTPENSIFSRLSQMAGSLGGSFAGVTIFFEDFWREGVSFSLLGVLARVGLALITMLIWDCWLCFNFSSDSSRYFCLLCWQFSSILMVLSLRSRSLILFSSSLRLISVASFWIFAFYSYFFLSLTYSIILRLISISPFMRQRLLASSSFRFRIYSSYFSLSIRFFSAYSVTFRFSSSSYFSFLRLYSYAFLSSSFLCYYFLRSISSCLSRCFSSIALISRSRSSLRLIQSASFIAFSSYFSRFSLENLFSARERLPPRPSPSSFRRRDSLGKTEESDRSRMVESTRV